MQILHHGAVDGVTGSCHQLVLNCANQSNVATLKSSGANDAITSEHKQNRPIKDVWPETSYLIDCGLFQGAETAGKSSAEQLEITFEITTIEALIVTHCHIDHVGRIPYLLAAGFNKPIFATKATAELLPLVIEDAIKVGVTRNHALIKAYLTRLSELLVAVEYNHWQPLVVRSSSCEADKVNRHNVQTTVTDNRFDSVVIQAAKFKFKPAGHILGSAYDEFDLQGIKSQSPHQAQKFNHRVVFSGDLGASYTPLLASPKSPYRADTLVIESTYGDKLHLGRKHRTRSLKQVIEKAVLDNGVVLVPAFSIGRTQELLYELEQIIYRNQSNKMWAEIDIIVDSPLAAEFTKRYQQFVSLWDDEAKAKVQRGRHPLDFSQLLTVETHEDHTRLVNFLSTRNRPAIVIAASGMCAGGRIVSYLNQFLSDKKADILFVGYQAKGTLGRDIQYYGPKGGYVYIDEQRINIAAQVHTISGYSAHADQANLINFVKRMRVKPQQIRIVHGDNAAKAVLAACYRSLLPECEIMIPS